jgi:LacI family transcriptional regulator
MVTLKKLAKELGVSISTISKSLSDSYEISEEVKTKVKLLAEKYNYKPNKVAQSLKSRKTMNIGVIIPNILNRFFAKVLYGIELEATKLGYNIITCLSNESIDKEKQSIELLINGSVDGFILAASEETQILKEYSHINNITKQDIPLVMFDRLAQDIQCDKVVIDDFESASHATNKLIEKNRKNIAFISNIANLKVGKKRKEGYKKAIENTFNTIDKSLILSLDFDTDYQSQIKTFLLQNPQIDAILSADNITGTLVINVSKSLGYKIPKDISVIGFADNETSNLTVPKLAFINQDAEQIGSKSLSILVDRLSMSNESNKDFTIDLIPYTFFKQESL